jgi:glycosyltransferase involved in cell wall biosynthesis
VDAGRPQRSAVTSAKVALVHDYLVERGGAEKALAALHEVFPEAPIYTAVYNAQTTLDVFRRADVRTSFLQRLTTCRERYRALLPLYPLAFRAFDLRAYDLVISSASGFAKGVRPRPSARHICYCYTPPRFVWEYQRANEKEQLPLPARLSLRAMRPYLAWLDRNDATRVDRFLAISQCVSARIQAAYGRRAMVVPPPIECDQFAPAPVVDEFFLVVSRLVPYKRIDLVIEAFNRNRLPLLIVGDGRARRRLESLARSDRIRFLGHRPQSEVRDLLATCRALIVAAEEDFGMTPLEANASGRPVIAYEAGGARETVVPGVTGVLFPDQTAKALLAALDEFAGITFDIEALVQHAHTFDKARFQRTIRELVEAEMSSAPVWPVRERHLQADTLS